MIFLCGLIIVICIYRNNEFIHTSCHHWMSSSSFLRASVVARHVKLLIIALSEVSSGSRTSLSVDFTVIFVPAEKNKGKG